MLPIKHGVYSTLLHSITQTNKFSFTDLISVVLAGCTCAYGTLRHWCGCMVWISGLVIVCFWKYKCNVVKSKVFPTSPFSNDMAGKNASWSLLPSPHGQKHIGDQLLLSLWDLTSKPIKDCWKRWMTAISKRRWTLPGTFGGHWLLVKFMLMMSHLPHDLVQDAAKSTILCFAYANGSALPK